MLDPPTIRHALSIAFISLPIRAQLALVTLNAFLKHEAHRVSALEDPVVIAPSAPLPAVFKFKVSGSRVENLGDFKGFGISPGFCVCFPLTSGCVWPRFGPR